MPRSSRWVVLVMVTGAALGGALAVRARRRRRAAPPQPVLRSVVTPPPAPARGADPSRSLVRMAAGAAIVVVLAIAVTVLTRPSSPGPSSTGPPSPGSAAAGDARPSPAPMSLADCQAAIAARNTLPNEVTCGYDTTDAYRPVVEPGADPGDPRYAGAALPINLSTAGSACLTGRDRPVLDTVRPVLSASFTSGPGLDHVESTFQLTGVDGPTDHDLTTAGDGGYGLTASLALMRQGDLTHGESYRWRVRGTPPYVGAGGWSSWCEFTVGETTSDDMGLKDARAYPVTLPVATWREIRAVLGPDGTHPPLEQAVKAATASASVTLNGSDWSSVVNGLCYHASEDDDAAYWKLADLVSAALGGPEHPTMGFPRG